MYIFEISKGYFGALQLSTLQIGGVRYGYFSNSSKA